MKDQVLLTTLKAIATCQSKAIAGMTKADVDRWYYIGCDLDNFYDTLGTWGEKLGCIPNTVDYFNIVPTKKFLDVGCGTGLTLHIARALGFDAYGIENDDAALRLLANTHGITDHIIVDDVLNFDKYGDYQVLFMYRPFADTQLQIKLETKIMAGMQQHAILIPQHAVTLQGVWVKP